MVNPTIYAIFWDPPHTADRSADEHVGNLPAHSEENAEGLSRTRYR